MDGERERESKESGVSACLDDDDDNEARLIF